MTNKSENLNELATALAKSQGEFPPIPKTKKVDITTKAGMKIKYNYADLADVIRITTPVLAKHGLSITQNPCVVGEKFSLETTIIHSSGQWKTSYYPLATFDKAQEQGSEITYARRYTLCGVLGVAAEEDDDGSLANEGEKKKATAKPKEAPKAETKANPNALVTVTQIKQMFSYAQSKGIKTEQLGEMLKILFNKTSSKELIENEYQYLMELLRTKSLEEIQLLMVEKQTEDAMNEGIK